MALVYKFKGEEMLYNGIVVLNGLSDSDHTLMIDASGDLWLDSNNLGAATPFAVHMMNDIGFFEKVARQDPTDYRAVPSAQFYDWGEKPEKKCTCGAKFTSRPDYHLDWCDLKRK